MRLDRRKAIALAARHGIPCEHHGASAPTYSGTAINLDVMDRWSTALARWPFGKPPDVAAERILHEVGHAIIVSPARRRLANYGLGQDHIGGVCRKLARVRDPKGEEAMATALTAAFGAALADGEWALRYLALTGFSGDDEGRRQMWAAIAELQKRGLLDGHRPTPRALGR